MSYLVLTEGGSRFVCGTRNKRSSVPLAEARSFPGRLARVSQAEPPSSSLITNNAESTSLSNREPAKGKRIPCPAASTQPLRRTFGTSPVVFTNPTRWGMLAGLPSPSRRRKVPPPGPRRFSYRTAFATIAHGRRENNCSRLLAT